MIENEFRNEAIIKASEINPIDYFLYKVIKSICKIIGKDKLGTGFFIKLYKDGKVLLCLMTNEHIITKDMIESKEKIDVKYDFEEKWLPIKLDEKERYIKYDKDLDITITEIIPNDKVKEKYFLSPNINNIDYINKDIYTPISKRQPN